MNAIVRIKISFIAKALVMALFVLVAVIFIGCGSDDTSESFNPSKSNSVFSVRFNSSNGGYIDGEAVQTEELGKDGSGVTAVAQYGYCFVKWSDGETEPTRTVKNVQSDFYARAIFERQTYILTYLTGSHGTLVGEIEQSVLYSDNGSAVTAVPDDGYEFKEWSDGITEASRTDRRVRGDITLTAFFQKKNYLIQYECQYVSDGDGIVQYGTIEGASVQNVGHGESASAVMAVPIEGYEFVCWSDGVTTAKRTDSDVCCDMTVAAFFRKKVYMVRYMAIDLSYDPFRFKDFCDAIDGECEQYVTHGESASTVKAIHVDGYEFAYWSDGSTDPERTDTNIMKVTLFIAYYRRIT